METRCTALPAHRARRLGPGRAPAARRRRRHDLRPVVRAGRRGRLPGGAGRAALGRVLRDPHPPPGPAGDQRPVRAPRGARRRHRPRPRPGADIVLARGRQERQHSDLAGVRRRGARPREITRNPARGFWLRQDLAHVLAVWSVAAGADRIHVVTVPPPGARPTVLLERVGQVVGYDAATLTTPPRRADESLGAPGAEVDRRLNELLGGGSTSGSTTGWSRTPSACTCARPAPHAPRCPTSTSRGRVGRRRDWSPRSATAGTTWWATSTTSPHERPRDARRTRRPRASCSRRRWRRCGPSPSRTPWPGGCAAPARRRGSGGAGDPCDPRAPVRGVPLAPQGGRAR